MIKLISQESIQLWIIKRTSQESKLSLKNFQEVLTLFTLFRRNKKAIKRILKKKNKIMKSKKNKNILFLVLFVEGL